MRPKVWMTMYDDPYDDARVIREIKALTEMGFDVGVLHGLFSDRPLRMYYAGAELVPVPLGKRRGGKLPFLIFYLRAFPLVVGLKGEAFHCQDLFSLPVAYLGAKLSGAGLIYDVHEYYIGTPALADRPLERTVWGAVERAFIGRADAVITVCDSIAEALAERYGIRRPYVVRNLPEFRRVPRTDSLRRWLGIPEAEPILLYQGVLQRGRGILVAVEALRRLERGVLVLLGDGEMRDEIEGYVTRTRMDGRVFMPGWVPLEELPLYTASADIGLCLIENLGYSYYLSLPNKLFQYIMAGVPVLASDFPEIGRIVRETGVGLPVDPSDPEDVADKARRLLEDGGLRRRCSENARRAAEVYNWEVERVKLYEIYQPPILKGLRAL